MRGVLLEGVGVPEVAQAVKRVQTELKHQADLRNPDKDLFRNCPWQVRPYLGACLLCTEVLYRAVDTVVCMSAFGCPVCGGQATDTVAMS